MQEMHEVGRKGARGENYKDGEEGRKKNGRERGREGGRKRLILIIFGFSYTCSHLFNDVAPLHNLLPLHIYEVLLRVASIGSRCKIIEVQGNTIWPV